MNKEELKKLRQLYLGRAALGTLFEHLDACLKNNFDDENQKLIEKFTFNDVLAREYPLSYNYTIQFLKKLIEKIESLRYIVLETIYKEYTDLINKPEQEYNFIIYEIECKEIIVQQSNKLVTNGTTGFKCWEGGLQLFEQIYANRKLFKGKKILELGCGIGFTGIALCSLCEFDSYLFSDYHEKVLEIVKNNLLINGFNIKNEEARNFYKFFESVDDDMKKENESLYEIPRGFSAPFNRQGALELFKKEFSSLDEQPLNDPFDLSFKKTENLFTNAFSEFPIFKNNSILSKKSKEFDEKINNFNEKLENFEEFLKDFEKKLNIFDENLTVNVQKRNSKNKYIHLHKTNENISKNVDVIELDWKESDEEIIAKFDFYKPDYIIGADLVYDPVLFNDLIRVIKLALATVDSGIIIVNTVRNEQTCKLFEAQLHKMQDQLENVCIQRTKLSKKLSQFQYLKINQPFILYNIRNED